MASLHRIVFRSMRVLLLVYAGMCVALCAWLMQSGSVVGMNIVVAVAPVTMVVAWVFFGRKVQNVVLAAIPSAIMLAIGIVLFSIAAGAGVDVPGGSGNFTCSSESLAQALIDPSMPPPEAKEVSFLTSCGAGWSEVLNYRGLRVARKCCVRVDVRQFDCVGSGLRLVPDASENPQVLTETAMRVATAACCPTLTEDVAPTGFSAMILTALTATVLSILANLLRRSDTWKAVVTAPMQKAFAFVSGCAEGCGSHFVCLVSCCLDDEEVKALRHPRRHHGRRRKANAAHVKTLTGGGNKQTAAMRPSAADEDGGRSADVVAPAAAAITADGDAPSNEHLETSEFSVHGDITIVLNACTAMTPCGRYTLVCGGDERGVQHEVLYDRQHLPYPIPIDVSAATTVVVAEPNSVTTGRSADTRRRCGSQLQCPTGRLVFSRCSRYVVYFADDGDFRVRCNESCQERTVPSWTYNNLERSVCCMGEDILQYDLVSVAQRAHDDDAVRQQTSTYFVGLSVSKVFAVELDGLFSVPADASSGLKLVAPQVHETPLDPMLMRVLKDDSDTKWHAYLDQWPRSSQRNAYTYLAKSGVAVCLSSEDNCIIVWRVLGGQLAAPEEDNDASTLCSIALPRVGDGYGPFEIENASTIRGSGSDDDVLQLILRSSYIESADGAAVDMTNFTYVTVCGGADGTPPSISMVAMPGSIIEAKLPEPLVAPPVVPDTASHDGGSAKATEREPFVATCVEHSSGVCFWRGNDAVCFVDSTMQQYRLAQFPNPIDTLHACRTETGQVMLFASLASSKQLHVRLLSPPGDGEANGGCCAVNAILPLAMTSEFCIYVSPNGAYVATTSTECALVFGTVIDNGRLPLLTRISGDFYRTTFSPDALLIACERQRDVLVCPVMSNSVCALALTTPSSCDAMGSRDNLTFLTMASSTSVVRTMVRVSDDGDCLPRKRVAEVLASHEITLRATPKQLQLTDDGQVVVAHLHDGSLHLVRCLGSDVAEPIPIPAEVVDNDFALVRLAALGTGATLVACVEHARKVADDEAGNVDNTSPDDVMLTLLELCGSRVTYRGCVRLLTLVPMTSLTVMPTLSSSSSNSSDDDADDTRATVRDLTVSKGGTLVAAWMSNSDGVHMWPLLDCIASWGAASDDVTPMEHCASKSAADYFPQSRRGSLVTSIAPLVLTPSPLMGVHYGNVWRETAVGELRFHSDQMHTLLRISRPLGHWTFHVEEWHLAATAPEPEEVESDARDVIDAGEGRVIRIAPQRTDRVGYMSGDPSAVHLNMAARCNVMVLLSSHGVSFYRRPSTGDDDDDDANAFFWWSGFVAALYAPSEYLAVPMACLIYGYVSSIVAASSGGEGISGFAARVCNGSTLQNWVDIVTVFMCRAAIVQSSFLPVCGDAELTTVRSNSTATRSNNVADIVKMLLFAQVFVLLLYPILLLYTLPGLGVFVIAMSPLVIFIGSVAVLALTGILVRRSYERKRWIGEPPPSVTRSERVRSWAYFYSGAVRLFLLCFVLVVGTNFTLQVTLRMATNFSLMEQGTGEYKRFYDECLQFNGDCTACTANTDCVFCSGSSTGTCLSVTRKDDACPGGRKRYSCENSNATKTCPEYDGDCAQCTSFPDCAYCQSSKACSAYSFSSASCDAAEVLVLQNSTCRANRTSAWWQRLPYLGPTTANKAQMLFYTLQLGSGTCSAARVTQSTWATANYITSLP